MTSFSGGRKHFLRGPARRYTFLKPFAQQGVVDKLEELEEELAENPGDVARQAPPRARFKAQGCCPPAMQVFDGEERRSGVLD